MTGKFTNRCTYMPEINQKILTDFAEFCRGRTFSYCEPKDKEDLHRKGKAVCHQIAKGLGLKKGEYYVVSNKAGIACSGEISLQSCSLYISIQPDSPMQGREILFRSCQGLKDYTGGVNNYLGIQDLRDGDKVISCLKEML